MATERWTRPQLKLAFNLYCQLPFGKLDQRNHEVIALASLIDRTPSAVAMKLVNFASLDPSITGTGRTGLGHASALDHEVWDEFHANWETLAVECQQMLGQLRAERGVPAPATPAANDQDLPDYTGETRLAMVERRVKQQFFRNAILSSYRSRCCMSGLSEPSLLVASHIVPWEQDNRNRLNPRNGLCLSALHDRAFDRGLIALSDELRIMVSSVLKRRADEFAERVLLPMEGRRIEVPERFAPDLALVAWHRTTLFDQGAEP